MVFGWHEKQNRTWRKQSTVSNFCHLNKELLYWIVLKKLQKCQKLSSQGSPLVNMKNATLNLYKEFAEFAEFLYSLFSTQRWVLSKSNRKEVILKNTYSAKCYKYLKFPKRYDSYLKMGVLDRFRHWNFIILVWTTGNMF